MTWYNSKNMNMSKWKLHMHKLHDPKNIKMWSLKFMIDEDEECYKTSIN